MRNLILIGGTLAIVGAYLANKMKTFADDLRVYVKPLVKPSIANGSLELPIRIQLDNPTRESFKVSQIYCTVYEKQADGSWKYIASSNPAMPELIIKPADTTVHVLKVRMPTTDAALSTLTKVLNFLDTKKVPSVDDYRVKGHLVVEGIKFPFDHFNQNTLPA